LNSQIQPVELKKASEPHGQDANKNNKENENKKANCPHGEFTSQSLT
jgi:hypothetical protein